MNVCLTGMTGYLGGAIAQELLGAGHTVRALVRRPIAAPPGVELVIGDLCEPGAAERALVGADAVIHTAGRVSLRSRDAAEVRRVNVEGTRSVLDAASRVADLRVVYTSSIAALRTTDRPEVIDADLDDGPPTRDAYIDSKRESEAQVIEQARRGLDVVSLCPAVTLGPDEGRPTSTRFVLEYLRGRNRIVFPGGVAFCDVRDVARAHVAALTRGRGGERFVLAGHNLTYADAMRTLYDLTGLHKPRKMPMRLLRVLATISESLSRVHSHSLEELTHVYLDRACRYPFYSSAAAEEVLGYHIRPLAETLTDTIRTLVVRGLVPSAIVRRLPPHLVS